jgi:ABC-type lipoprotein export system ATPase subunit
MTAIAVRDAFRLHRSAGATSLALQGLSLRVDEGEIVVVLGPSGSGKTTLLRILSGFDRLSAGSAHILETDLEGLSMRALAGFRAHHLGLLDQHYARALSPDLICAHTVALNIELLGRPRTRARGVAARLLMRVGLGDRLDALPATLSGGEQQRVAVCAALAHKPRLLLADEPAGEVDSANAAVVYELIAELVCEQHSTALIVSHDEAAAEIADRLVYIRDGRVVEEAQAGRQPAIVITDPGWIRLPDPLLQALGKPRRLHVKKRDNEIALVSAETRRRAAPPAPTAPLTPTRPPATVAELRHVTMKFPTAPDPILDDVSHLLRGSTFTALVGRSGSGKTTLLHLLAGLQLPTSGEVIIAGHEITELPRSAMAELRRGHIALVTQEPVSD